VARTYVSSAGSDANACSLTAPCRNFSGAAAKTLARGEITALDSATYGNITITKALTLQAAPGAHAVMGTGSSTTPVVVNAGEADVVVLRNLHVTRAGMGTTTRGIQLIRVGALHIESCVVAGFSDTGIYAVPDYLNADGKGPRLFVKDTVARDNGVGLAMSSVIASVDHSRVENNATGVLFSGQAIATVRDSLVAGNADYGLKASAGPSNYTAVENCVVTNNGTGIQAAEFLGLRGVFHVSHTMISANNTGLSPNGGSIQSFGNNRLANNNSNGAFTSTIQEQ
jgi:nitrous oxidase accessory protein NosD